MLYFYVIFDYSISIMAVDIETLEKMIKDELPGANVRIDDVRGDGEHYAAHITYSGFVGKNRVQQHQMVYASLKGKMGNELHALQIHTNAQQQ